MSINKDNQNILKVYQGDLPIKKVFSQNRRIFPDAIGTYLENISALGGDVSLAQESYNKINVNVRSTAQVLIFPSLVKKNVVCAMNNASGEVIECPFDRASQATRYDSNLDIQLVEPDMPRIDYGNYADNARILIERESTNLLRDSGFTLALDALGYAHEIKDVDWLNHFTKSVFLKNNSYYYKYADLIANTSYTLSAFVKTTNGNKPNFAGTTAERDCALVIDASLYPSGSQCRLLKNSIWRVHTSKKAAIDTRRGVGILKSTGNSPNALNGTGYQLELGTQSSSYIPTTNSQATRSSESLTYTLSNDCSVYLKTSQQNIVLDKPAGVWNIHEDLNNEGVECIAIFDRVLTTNDKLTIIH